MIIICPHCQNVIESAEFPAKEILCPTCGSSFRLGRASSTRTDEPHPRHFGKFEVLDVAGVGAFGTVYKARDPELDRVVAIKVPRAGQLASSRDLNRFLREARSVAQL